MSIDVIKRNHLGEEILRYRGEVIAQDDEKIILIAFFDRDTLEVNGFTYAHGDKLIETFYFDRWYNIFEIYDGDSDKLKGWYCNVGYPAEQEANAVSYRDLALDLLVFADGRQIVLDEDEFAELNVDQKIKAKAHKAFDELQKQFTKRFERY